VDTHKIAWHEKTLGQLFCDETAKDIIALLLNEMTQAGAQLSLQTSVLDMSKTESGFFLTLSTGAVTCSNLVVACGGKSIPKMGATGFGYRIAGMFDLPLVEPRPALVPFVFSDDVQASLKPLAGVSVNARVTCNGTSFEEGLLITHRGLSGPSILQISSYWQRGDQISIQLLPHDQILDGLKARRTQEGKKQISTILADLLPKRLADELASLHGFEGRVGDCSDQRLQQIAHLLSNWVQTPSGTEGYRTAEVTLGGVDTTCLSSKTMEVTSVPGLYFIGEVVDVTGWLGGYNFQWAWSSGWTCGTAIAAK
jgi:predicted Rossmann fold flavoprotein